MRRSRTELVLALALGALLVYLIVVPVSTIVWGSLGTTPTGIPGPRTLAHYRTALSAPTFVGSIRTTIAFAGGVTVVATLLGGYLAWVTERTDAPGRRLVYLLVLVPIVVPGILTTIAWILVLHERIGIANGLLAAIGASRPRFDAYTLPAMVWVEGFDSLTLPFLLIAAALRTMDPAVEEASVLSGASTSRTAFRITLPLVLPAVSAAALLVFVRAIGSFAVPAAMGLPGGVRVLATEVFLAARRFPSDSNLAAAYAVLHLALAAVVLALHQRITRHGDRFVTIGARVAHNGRIALRRTRTVHAASALAILGVAVVLPLVVIVVSSLLPRPMPPTELDPSLFTLRRYAWALESVVARRALVNNVVVGGLASVVTVVIAAIVAWVSTHSRLRWRRLLDILATAPIALPGTVLGLALLWWYLIVPLPIYATRWLVGIAFVTAFLPYAVRAAAALLGQLSPALEEASAMSGAGWSRTFARIVLPLVAPGLIAAWLYVVARTFTSLALPALLAGPGGEMLPSVVYDLYESARYSELNALGVLMIGGMLAIAGLARLSAILADRWSGLVHDPSTSGERGATPTGIARQERTAE